MVTPRVRPEHRAILQRQKRYLAAYAECGSLKEAAQITGIGKSAHYEWLAKYPEYRVAYETATQRAIDSLEEEAKRRAMVGSDNLMMFMLKAKRPNEFRDMSTVRVDGKTIHQLNVNGQITHAHAHVTINPESLDADQCRLLLSLLDAQKVQEQPQLAHKQPETIILQPEQKKTRNVSANDFFDE